MVHVYWLITNTKWLELTVDHLVSNMSVLVTICLAGRVLEYFLLFGSQYAFVNLDRINPGLAIAWVQMRMVAEGNSTVHIFCIMTFYQYTFVSDDTYR